MYIGLKERKGLVQSILFERVENERRRRHGWEAYDASVVEED